MLNKEQLEAVDVSEGPLLIVAGAGTGKTTVIVEKIKRFITDKNIKPEEILALTFTEKAAAEMEERVDKVIPYGYTQSWISTFHSFADTILRREITRIGLNPHYQLMTTAENIIFFRNHLFEFPLQTLRPLGNPNKFIEAMLQHFSRLRDENITPEEYVAWAQKAQSYLEMDDIEKKQSLELAEAYQFYQELKIKESMFDFSDLIFYVINVFKNRPAILAKYQQQFKHVLVDEFQDTNIAQYELIKLLCPPGTQPNLTVVGDDSQAIYKFRGASVSNIMAFMHDYPQAKQITLIRNYRSHQSILDASYTLIRHNDPDTLEAKLGIDKKLIGTEKGSASDITPFVADKVDEEADFVIKTIQTLKSKKKYSYSDMAILVRANNHAEPFLTAMARNGIPYYFFGPGALFRQPEIKDLIAYLKLLYDVNDSISFYRVLSMPLIAMNAAELALILSFARTATISLYRACLVIAAQSDVNLNRVEYENYKDYLPAVSDETKAILVKTLAMIERHLTAMSKDSAGQILYYFLEDTGYLKLLVDITSEAQEKVVLNITKFFDRLKSYEAEHDDSSVAAIVNYIDMSMELGESPSAENDRHAYVAVNILTVHGSKGLEFPVVFLVNLTNTRFPSRDRKETLPIPQELIKEQLPEGDYHILEERRLFYVALTRAKDKLYLTVSKRYGENKRDQKISPFLIETVGAEKIEGLLNIKKEVKEQLSIFDFNPQKKIETYVSNEKPAVTQFSYSQIDTYLTCPLKYKYQYILKIPTPWNSAATFGNSIHQSLQKFYKEFILDSSITFERMHQLLDESWIPLGYNSPDHEMQMKKQGYDLLRRYYDTFHTQHVSIVDLEKPFRIRIDRDIAINGKIDRIDKKTNGIEIIDYKTGKRPLDRELKKSLQLSIYALAALDQPGMADLLEHVTLTFYYLQDMEKISMTRNKKEIEEVKDTIVNTATAINAGHFEPKVGIHCNFCPFRMICEAWQ